MLTFGVKDFYVWGLVFFRFVGSNSYVWGLVFLRLRILRILTFWGLLSNVWRLVLLRLRASNSFVKGLVFLRLGVKDSYLLGLVIFTFGG